MQKGKIGQTIFNCVIFGILFASLTFTICNIDSKEQLYGVTNSTELPQASADGIWLGNFQGEVDKYYQENFPLRTAMVRWNNQLLYWIKGIINGSIIVGKDGWLYSEEYVANAFSDIPDATKSLVEEYALKVKQCQEIIEKSGKEFVYIITPSKAEMYPENLPYRYLPLSSKRDKIVNCYDYLLQRLTDEGIEVVDMLSILKEAEGEIPFFSKTGTHWNYYAASIGASSVLNRLGYENVTVEVEPMKEPQGTEQDLYLLTNIYRGEVDKEYYHTKLDFSEYAEREERNVLEMGTSFSGELASSLAPDGTMWFDKYVRFQYFILKNTYCGDQITVESGNFNNEALLDEILKADIIILENNNSYVPDSHIEFVDYIISHEEDIINGEGNQDDFIKIDDEVILDFSNGGSVEEYTRIGFYAGEENGRWSKENAELAIKLCAEQDIVLDFSENLFLEDTVIAFNNMVVWDGTVDSKEALKNIVIPVEMINNKKMNFIQIKSPQKLLSLKEKGMGEDERITAQWWNKVIIRKGEK